MQLIWGGDWKGFWSGIAGGVGGFKGTALGLLDKEEQEEEAAVARVRVLQVAAKAQSVVRTCKIIFRHREAQLVKLNPDAEGRKKGWEKVRL